jgi:serine phosphatase RsbU (regulator of sigma subunit)
VRPGEPPQLLESQSSVLGLIEDAVGTDATIDVVLKPGDRVVIYTDGFTESFIACEREPGIDGFSEIVREAALWPLPEMKQHILDGVAAFRCGPPVDDVSLVVVSIP